MGERIVDPAARALNEEQISIKWGNRTAILRVQPFDGDVDVESILKIDYSNIVGEILTFPVLFNRIANMRAEMANILSHQKMDCEIFEAQLTQEYRNKLLRDGGKATVKDIESSVLLDARYSIKKKIFFQTQKDYDYLDSLYWSAQSKDTKLNKLSDKLRPEEFNTELLVDTINGVFIKMKKNVIA